MDVEKLIESAVSAVGYELVACELVPEGRHSVLRVYIDSPKGVSIEDCARVSRQISAVLDIEDPMADRYNLEVSSPGLDRPLTKEEHFERFINHRAKVKLRKASVARRNFTGVIQAVENGKILLDVDGELFTLAIADIEKANLVPKF